MMTHVVCLEVYLLLQALFVSAESARGVLYRASFITTPVTKSHGATQGRGQQMSVGFCLCLRNGWLPDGLWSQLGAPFLLQTL